MLRTLQNTLLHSVAEEKEPLTETPCSKITDSHLDGQLGIQTLALALAPARLHLASRRAWPDPDLGQLAGAKH